MDAIGRHMFGVIEQLVLDCAAVGAICIQRSQL